MRTDTKKKILELARSAEGIRPHDLVAKLKISHAALHRHLKTLLMTGVLAKRGQAPHVIYVAVSAKDVPFVFEFSSEINDKFKSHFCYFTPSGEEIEGTRGFLEFLNRTDQHHNPQARAIEYLQIVDRAESFRDLDGLIDGTQKVATTFGECCLERVYYSDFYSLPKYGKSRLGQYLLHGKSGQNLRLINKIANLTKDDVSTILNRHSIEAVAFAPHSIPRKVPFLKEFRRNLNLELPEITLTKAYSGDLPIAQKTLSKLSERIENARETIFVKERHIPFHSILLIDDALGSGATLNEIARKLRKLQSSTIKIKIYGYAVVGSYKGFEVIKEA